MRTILIISLFFGLLTSCKKTSDTKNQEPVKKPVLKTQMDKEPPKLAEKPKVATPKKVEPPKKISIVPADAVEVKTPIVHKTFTLNKEPMIAMESLTMEAAKKLRGYNKKVPLGITVVFKKNGDIHKIEISSHSETPDFITRIEKEWIPKFNDLLHTKPIVGPKGKAIDALSEATMSTDAILKTVDLMRNAYLKNFVKTGKKAKKKGKKGGK
ncbi:FMN-binding protein [Myxococcota bacterium]|nr:FMN-binding protein [Myxococcota bacterium]MBU1533727.1 FMN-binding protein [Myxococcota bacterium]